MLLGRKVAAAVFIRRDRGEERTKIGKQARVGEQEIKLRNMLEHEEFKFSSGSKGKLQLPSEC